jgi:hypothetical protein
MEHTKLIFSPFFHRSENMCIRCVGSIKEFQNNKSINAFKISPIEDANHITAHLMDVVFTHILNTKGNKDVRHNTLDCTARHLTIMNDGTRAPGVDAHRLALAAMPAVMLTLALVVIRPRALSGHTK